MNEHNAFRLAAGLLLSVLAGTATASNLRWLDNSPARHFTDDDWELASDAARRALNEAADGETVSWENPRTGASGTLSPLSTLSRDGATCRRLQTSSSARGTTGGSVFEFCQRPDGTWGAVQGDATAPPVQE